MKLGDLFANQITVSLAPDLHITESKLAMYINSWASEIYEIIITMQQDLRLDHYIYQLPNGDGVLEFNLDHSTNILDITFQDKNHLKFQQKFKKLLDIVYKDLALKKNHKLVTEQVNLDDVDRFFENL